MVELRKREVWALRLMWLIITVVVLAAVAFITHGSFWGSW